MDDGFQYVQENGIALESSYPYKAQDGQCHYSQSMNAFKISGHVDVPPQDAQQLKAAVAQGPVSIAIEADSLWFQLYR